MKKYYPLVILLVITITVGLLTSHVSAAERKPSAEDYRNLEEIKRNQAAIAETCPAYSSLVTAATGKAKIDAELIDGYNRFLDLKGWNEAEVAALNANGWNVDWATKTLIDAQAAKPLETKKTVSVVPSCSAANVQHATGNKIDLSRFGEKDRLAHDQLLTVLRDAGFSGNALKTAYAVARAESGGRPKAHNNNAKTKDLSYGIFQINMRGALGPARHKQHGLASNDDLYQPEVNAKIAYQMSGGGKNWKPWGAYTNGSYKRYLDAL